MPFGAWTPVLVSAGLVLMALLSVPQGRVLRSIDSSCRRKFSSQIEFFNLFRTVVMSYIYEAKTWFADKTPKPHKKNWSLLLRDQGNFCNIMRN
jgi:hypothetical protein